MSETQGRSPSLTTHPVKPTPVIGTRQPLPAGVSILSPSDLNPIEAAKLMSLGWDGKSEVPSNLAELLSDVQVADDSQTFQDMVNAAKDRLPEGAKQPSSNFDPSQVKTVHDPSILGDALEKYSKVMNDSRPENPPSAFEQARTQGVQAIRQAGEDANYSPDVLRAREQLRSQLNEGLGDDEDDIDTETPAVQTADNPPGQAQPETPRSRFESLKELVSQEDIDDYVHAVITNSQFEKTYSLFGGKIHVTFTEPGPAETYLCIKQEAIDGNKGRYDRTNLTTFLDTSARYNFAACLRQVSIVGVGTPIDIPASMSVSEFLETLPQDQLGLNGVEKEDTAIRFWYQFIVTKALKSAMYRVIFKKFEEFQTLFTRLEALSQFPDFTGPQKQSS